MVNRRSFLKALGLVALLPAAQAIPQAKHSAIPPGLHYLAPPVDRGAFKIESNGNIYIQGAFTMYWPQALSDPAIAYWAGNEWWQAGP